MRTLLTLISGLTSRSIGLEKGTLIPGYYYRIQLQVTAPGYSAGMVSAEGIVNFVPYNGQCSLDRAQGKS